MKRLLSIVGLLIGPSFATGLDDPTRGEGITVQKVQGEVSVRHGVAEEWTSVRQGDILRPDDTMKTGKKGRAVIITRGQGPAAKTILLPSEVIVDMSDVRELSQEELMLKLTMEKVRSSGYEWKNNEMNIPNATVMHGDPPVSPALTENQVEVGTFELNGARVLYDNGFYSTCALRTMGVLRRYPSLKQEFKNCVLVAESLEKANLRSEALNEYNSLAALEGVTPAQKGLLKEKIDRLRNR